MAEECSIRRERDIGATDIVQKYKGRGESAASADDDVFAVTQSIERSK